LKDINFEIRQGELISVIGKVGAGKSMMFMSLLNEFDEAWCQGHNGVNGRISYVEQQPFIFADTFKNNITFGRIYDE